MCLALAIRPSLGKGAPPRRKGPLTLHLTYDVRLHGIRGVSNLDPPA